MFLGFFCGSGLEDFPASQKLSLAGCISKKILPNFKENLAVKSFLFNFVISFSGLVLIKLCRISHLRLSVFKEMILWLSSMLILNFNSSCLGVNKEEESIYGDFKIINRYFWSFFTRLLYFVIYVTLILFCYM